MKRQVSESPDTAIPVTADFSSNEDWRFERPVWDTEKCIRCGVCYLSCPDGAIFQNDEGFYEANLTYCKGCGVCVLECWTGCISLEPATERPPWLVK